MSKSTYRPGRMRLAAATGVFLLLIAAATAGMLRGRMLLRSALDGDRHRAHAHTHLPEFELRAQMHSGQAASRVNGWLSVIGQEAVFCKAIDGVELYADVYEPIGGNADTPWALLLHGGLGTNASQLIDVACELSLAGYRVLLPDARAHGCSGGEIASLGICESEDVIAWTRWITLQHPAARIVIFAQADGAAAALLAADRLDHVYAIAADSAYSSVSGRAAQMLGEIAPACSHVDRRLFDWAYRMAFGKDMAEGDILAGVRNLDMPIFLIHATGDEDIQAWHSEDIARAAGERAQLLMIEGAAHGMARYSQPDVYYGRLLSFYEKALQ